MEGVKCPAAFVTFLLQICLPGFQQTGTQWPSLDTCLLHLPHRHTARGWITDAGGERRPTNRLRSYFRMYMEEDFLQTSLSPSVNTSAGVCVPHPS